MPTRNPAIITTTPAGTPSGLGTAATRNIGTGDNDVLTVAGGNAIAAPMQAQINGHVNLTADNPHGTTKAHVGLGNVTNDAQVKRSDMGVASGVATLGADSKVPATQLPATTFPVTSVNGQTGAVVLTIPVLPVVDGAANVGSSRTLGTGALQAVAGNDSRLSDTRTPADSSVTNIKVASNAAIDESKLNLASDALPAVASRRTLGVGATQAAAGNDVRFTDARTPLDGSITDAKISASAAIAESKINLASDAAVGVASRRTLGTGALQAASGNHVHIVATAVADGFMSAANFNALATILANQPLKATINQSMALIALNALATYSVTVVGATVGMGVLVTPPLADAGNMSVRAWVSAQDTVTLVVTALALLSAGTRTFIVRVFS